jgi:hypothetical protein
LFDLAASNRLLTLRETSSTVRLTFHGLLALFDAIVLPERSLTLPLYHSRTVLGEVEDEIPATGKGMASTRFARSITEADGRPSWVRRRTWWE